MLRVRTAFCILLGLVAVGKGSADPIGKISSIAAPDHSTFRTDYTYFPEAEGWLKFHRIPTTWHKAREACYREGTHLASPNNKGLLLAMRLVLQMNRSKSVHTGVHTIATQNDYFSEEGVHITSMPVTWAEGEPDNFHGTEQCITMRSFGELADVKCDSVHAFMCYKEKISSISMNECETYDRRYVKNDETGSCYKVHKETFSTWLNAYSTCAAEGSHLAVINSEMELEILTRLSDKNSCHYIGVYNWAQEKSGMDHWTTVDGKTLEEAGFSRWNNKTEHMYCAYVNLDRGDLNTVYCEHKGHCGMYICEKEMPNTSEVE